MMIVSAFIGVASSLIGLYLSYYMNIASGAAIVLVATAIFLITLVVSPTRGMARKSPLSGAKP
jgi:ABC-type Mn2+/Zn2+ transport system permease subunit